MRVFIKLLKNPLSATGTVLLIFFSVVAVLAPVLAPPTPYQLSPYIIPRHGFSLTPRPPSREYIFGTTSGQRDIFYGVVWGTRTAFRIGLIVVGLGSAIGVIIGSIAAFYGGLVDELLMRITDIFMSFPFLLSAMVLTTVLGKGLDRVMIALVVFGWMGYARLIRSEVLHIKELDYVQAAKASGASDLRIVARHILPNAIYPILITATMDVGAMVLAAASLSFLGVGAEPGYADWGQLISYSRNWIVGRTGEVFAYWYTVFFPGAAIFLFVFAWTLVGDGLRDILDPRMRGVERH